MIACQLKALVNQSFPSSAGKKAKHLEKEILSSLSNTCLANIDLD